MKRIHISEAKSVGVSHDPSLKKKVLFEPGEIPGLRHLCRIRMKPGDTASSHSHPDGREVFVLVSGHIRFDIEGRQVDLETGHSLFVEPGESHAITGVLEPSDMIYFFVFSPENPA